MSIRAPLGIFWDIENCPIPNNKSVSSCVKQIRDFIAEQRQQCGYAKEFSCPCDVFTLGKTFAEELDRNGVNVIHVNTAAENKLQELIDMFVDKYGDTSSAVLCIISCDINLAKRIRNARRKDFDVLLIHGINCSVDLKNLVNEYHLYEDIIKNADISIKFETEVKQAYLYVSNLPIGIQIKDIENVLSFLTNNCGLKLERIDSGKGFIRFNCIDDAQTCLSKINSKSVFGNKIQATLSNGLMSGPTSDAPIPVKLDNTKQRQLSNETHYKSMCSTNLKQTSSTVTTQIPAERKSVLKGLFILCGSNYTEVVRNLVRVWNDPDIKPEFIRDVQSTCNHRPQIRKHTLIIEAVDGQSSRALVSGAKTHSELISMKGLVWNAFFRFIEPSTEQSDSSSDRKSVIVGLHTEWEQNVTELVRNMVSNWNDIRIPHNYIESIERSGKFRGKGGNANIFVTATSAENSKILVNGARRYLTGTGIRWFQSKPPAVVSEKPNFPVKEERVRKDNKKQDISNILSVITGVDTRRVNDVTEFVRQIVKDWNDTEIKPDFIKLVERDRNPKDKVESPLLFVTATSPDTCIKLVIAAKKYLNVGTGVDDPKWVHYHRKGNRNKERVPEFAINEVEDRSGTSSFTQNITKSLSDQSLDEVCAKTTAEITDDMKCRSERKNSSTHHNSESSVLQPLSEVKSESTPFISIANPTVAFNYSIGDRMKSGLIIYFSGRINIGPQEGFTIEFCADIDVAFHFDVRVTQLLAVRNTKTDGKWDPEERQYESYPFVLGKDFDAMIRIDDQKYMVAVSGQHFCNFEHRISMTRVNKLSIFGDITVDWLRFLDN